VGPGETGYEVEIPPDECVAAGTLFFHVPCHDAWLWACHQRPLASAG
jgi:hypothetical protein